MVDIREFGNGKEPNPVLAPSLGRFRLFGSRPRTSVRMSAAATAIAEPESVKLPEIVECTGADDVVIDEVVPDISTAPVYEGPVHCDDVKALYEELEFNVPE